MTQIETRTGIDFQAVEFLTRKNMVSDLQAETAALVDLIGQESHPQVRSLFTDQLDETLQTIQSQLTSHEGSIGITMDCDEEPITVVFPREKITGIKFLSLPNGGSLYTPVADVRIRTPDDKPIALFKSEIPNPGRWHRFFLKDTKFSLES